VFVVSDNNVVVDAAPDNRAGGLVTTADRSSIIFASETETDFRALVPGIVAPAAAAAVAGNEGLVSLSDA
jgi:hypothetical protein